jgi:DNA-binding transcriptional ArsR family regulator
MSIIDCPWKLTLFYPSRGVGNVWLDHVETPDRALALLLGDTRARILSSLHAPSTTQDLARKHRMPASGVSHHLKQLSASGIIGKSRDGRVVRYRLSSAGETLLALFEHSVLS